MPIKPQTHKPFGAKRARHAPQGATVNYGKGRGGRQWRRTREAIFERDKYLCQIHLRAGKIVPVSLHGDNAGICDHIRPLAEGGTDDHDNLQTICKQCDKVKSAKESQRGNK